MALELLKMASQASLASPLKLDPDSPVQAGPKSVQNESKLTALTSATAVHRTLSAWKNKYIEKTGWPLMSHDIPGVRMGFGEKI